MTRWFVCYLSDGGRKGCRRFMLDWTSGPATLRIARRPDRTHERVCRMYHVAILANLKKNAPRQPDQPPDAWADLDSEHTIEAIAAALREGGHRTTFLEANVELLDKVRE